MISNSVKLKVQNAKRRDTGRNIARIDPNIMDKFKVQTGDVISLFGKKESAAIAWPSYAQDNDLGIIRIDSRLQKNTGTKVNDIIEIRKVKVESAGKVVIAPINFSIKIDPRLTIFVKRKLNNYPVTLDDYIYISIGIGKDIIFKVVVMNPSGICVIRQDTELIISDETIDESLLEIEKITYKDIGGLRKEIDEIRTLINLTLKEESTTNKLDIDIPKGILFVGPPGIGKTLLATALAHEIGYYRFISVTAPDIFKKSYAESGKKLNLIFSNVESRAPSVLFIDHIDAIAPKIQKEMIDKQAFTQHRIVTQLLGLMDGLKSIRNFIVIGATHKLDLIEPALLRPGRFDKIIHFPLPDLNSRVEIYKIHTQNLHLEDDVSIEDLARQSENYTGADIKGVCGLATFNAIKRLNPDRNFEPGKILYHLPDDLKLNKQDFLDAIKEIAQRLGAPSEI